MNTISNRLYDLLTSKDFTVKTFIAPSGKSESDLDKANLFSFPYEINGKKFTNVVILLADDNNLEMFVSGKPTKGMNKKQKIHWKNFNKQIKAFSIKNLTGYSLSNLSQLSQHMQTMASSELSESYYGTKKTSYNPQGNAKIIIKHSKPIGEGDKRYYNISSIFIETKEGERFKLPFNKLPGARAMARHITEGGNPYDEFGSHISEMVNDINILKGFVRRSKMFEDDEETLSLVETGRTHYNNTRNQLRKIATKKGYSIYKESWKPFDVIEHTEEDINALRSKFTKEAINKRVNDALPLLTRLSKSKELTEFEDWVNDADQKEPIYVDMHSPTINEQILIKEALEQNPLINEDDTNSYKEIDEFIETYGPSTDVNNIKKNNDYVYATLAISLIPNSLYNIRLSSFKTPLTYIGDSYKHLIDTGMLFFKDINDVVFVEKDGNKGMNFFSRVLIFNSITDVNKFRTIMGLTLTNWNINYNEINMKKLPNLNEDISNENITDLINWFKTEHTLGIDALNVINDISIINDATLNSMLLTASENDPNSDAREVVLDWIDLYLEENPVTELSRMLETHYSEFTEAMGNTMESMQEEKDLDTDKQCSCTVMNDKITNKGNGMNKFKEYSVKEEEVKNINKDKVNESIHNIIEPAFEDDFKNLVKRTNYLLQK